MNRTSLLCLSFVFHLFFFTFLNAQQAYISNDVMVMTNNVVDKELLKNIFPQPIVIKELSFNADVVFLQEEFLHICAINKGDHINADILGAALERCVKKNKFSTIKMTSIMQDDGVALHFIFDSLWSFKKIKIHHVYQGKHALLQFYLMERGDIFDESKHEHSIHKIREFLINNGYFDCNITSNFEYDHRTKEVVVHISIQKGKRFSFGAITVEVTIEDGNDDEKKSVSLLVKKKLSHALSSRIFTKEQLNKEITILKDYLAKKGFLHSAIKCKQEVDHDHAIVKSKWKINIHQKREIVFFGHRFFSKKELLERVLAFGKSVWLLPASLLAEEIVRAYKSKGFLDAQVITQEEKNRSFFIIKEGQRAVIKAIEIKNGKFGNQTAIKKQYFSKLLKHGYYDAQLYDEAVALLTNYYFNQGFVSFVVVNYEFISHDTEHEYTLVITIDEGAQKCITSVVVEGYPEITKQAPFNLQHDDHVPLNSKIIDEQRACLVNHFQALGFLHARFKSVIESHGDNIAIKWIVDTGEKVCFGKTIMQGSSLFPFCYVEQLLQYNEGDLWDQSKIKQTYKILKDLEIFETIHFSIDHNNTQENKPVIAKLHLDDRYEIRTRAGLELQHVRKYQTFSGLTYKLGGTALIKNPTNCADQIRFDCDFARSHREVVGRYRRPWFTRNPLFTIAQIYSISYDQPGFIGSTNDVYTVIQNGFLCGIQKKGQRSDIGINSGCEWMKLQIDDDEEPLSFAHAIDFKPQLLDKMVPFFFIEPTFMFECVDNVLNPTYGGIGLISFKGMIPIKKKYKDSSFFKLLFEQSFFIPFKSVVAAFRFRCGHIFYREFSGIMPSERFYLGGSHSLRGYEADLAPPLGVFVDDDGKHHVVPRGGRTMVNGNIELRFPLYKRIGGVVFQDLGALSGNMFADFKMHHILAATGFGLRIFTPIGPLRFDIGWKWRKQLPIERSFAWFLTFGQAF